MTAAVSSVFRVGGTSEIPFEMRRMEGWMDPSTLPDQMEEPRMVHPMHVGLTGGVASGKSTVAALLRYGAKASRELPPLPADLPR